jgi:hypothetical protein
MSFTEPSARIRAGQEDSMGNSSQGIVMDKKGQEQPADKERAQTVHKTDPKDKGSVSREATRDPKLTDANRTPGSGTVPDDKGNGTTG